LFDALFDTSLYVAAMRVGSDGAKFLRSLASGANLWLSAVVLEELYAGTSERSRIWVKRLEEEFDCDDRILVPNLEDWISTGETLNGLAIKYGYEKIGRGRLTNDALVAMSAARTGIRVITNNAKDFQRLAEFRPFDWTVAAI
jgi:predicted nucleic acid-binding protein